MGDESLHSKKSNLIAPTFKVGAFVIEFLTRLTKVEIYEVDMKKINKMDIADTLDDYLYSLLGCSKK